MKFFDKIFRAYVKLMTSGYVRQLKRADRIGTEESPERVLILGALFLGDLMMLSPFIAQLKRDYPQAKIGLICNPGLKSIAGLFSLDLVVEARKISINAARSIGRWSDGKNILIYNIFSWQVVPMVKWKCPDARLISFADPKKRLNHLADQLVEFPHRPTLAIEIPFLLLNTQPLARSTIPLDQWAPVGKYSVIHLGARVMTRRMPLRLLRDCIEHEVNKGLKVWLTAGPNEIDKASMEAGLHTAGLSAEVMAQINWCLGTLALTEIPKLLIHAECYIGMDTGVSHLAKALGVPARIFLGPSQPELFGGDDVYSRSRHFGIVGLSCRTKKTFHGLGSKWIGKCDLSECNQSVQVCADFDYT